MEKVLPYVDFFYVDLKIADSAKHKQYTGQENTLILENIHRLSKTQIPIVIRIPVIPGVNDSEDDMRAFGEIIRNVSNEIQGVELLKYNPLASSKYDSVGKKYHNFGVEPQTDKKMCILQAALQTTIGDNCRVYFY